MKASILLETLQQYPDLDQEAILAVYDSLPGNAKVSEFRGKLIKTGIMSYTQIMNIFVHDTLIPQSKKILKKIEAKRKTQVHFKPEKHEQKFQIKDGDYLLHTVAFASGELPIQVPKPDLASMKFNASDEKQAVMLAMDLVEVGELKEAEVIILETLESFKNSLAAINVLCWMYLCTGHNSQSEQWAKHCISKGLRDQRTIELLCLSEQLQNKHMMAAAHYQKLLRLKQVKSIWYLLLAYSQEKSQCRREAAENYQIYTRIGRDETLKEFANRHLEELTAL
ncbi:hypothetical protein [Reinekea sp. G2M2-21]|uniref:hypothetical protein n=1 Tax=Reinekea sp. G2M2-21 TaxID=2788942 RepID=UPI0018A9EAE2|nr:hypothetical protein [Reinekea sp. G2M2-21]